MIAHDRLDLRSNTQETLTKVCAIKIVEVKAQLDSDTGRVRHVARVAGPECDARLELHGRMKAK